jgi:hypothetical protein
MKSFDGEDVRRPVRHEINPSSDQLDLLVIEDARSAHATELTDVETVAVAIVGQEADHGQALR